MNKKIIRFAISMMLTAVMCTQVLAVPVGAVVRAKTETKSNKDTKTTTTQSSDSGSGDTSGDMGTDAETTDATTQSNTPSKSSKSSKSASASTPQYDAKGNLILMTDAQRKSKFKSKTNPKMGVDPGAKVYRPLYNGFVYADFGTFNSYNSSNGLGGRPIYLIGTITDIEKVTENPAYYGVVLAVNDADGYQWYMRATISKLQYANFHATFIGKSGYIFGTYAGYSGVTNRPMMDVTVLYPNGSFPVNMSAFK